MQKSLRLFLFLFLLAISYCGFSQQNYAIQEIKFSGNKTFSSGQLLELMNFYDRNFFQKHMPFIKKEPDLFSEEVLNGDIERLINFYQKEGFLFVRIETENLDVDDEQNSLKLAFNITEGQPVLVGSVSFEIMEDSLAADETLSTIIEDVRKDFTLKPSERFRDELVDLDRELLIAGLNNLGFPYAKVYQQLRLEETRNTVDLKWIIESGPKCRFGDVEIDGERLIPEGSIRRQVTIKKGDIFNQREIDRTQQLIYALGVFQIVSVKALLSNQPKKVIPVQIQIKEAKRFQTKLGFGYGSEERFRGTIDSRILGLIGGTRRLNLFLKRSGIEPHHANLEVVQPAFISPKSTFIINPFTRQQVERGFNVNRFGIRTSIHYPFTNYIKGSLSYIFEDVNQDTTDFNIDIQDIEGFRNLYNKSSIVFGATFNNSRPLFTPSSGMLHSATFKLSGLGFGSDFNYNKLTVDLRYYQRFLGSVLAHRLKFGSIRSFDDNNFIPVEDRFYAGGTVSVRGWQRQLLGPLDSEGDPIGGKSLLEGSTELRYPIYWVVGGVFFLDFGNVWEKSFGHRIRDLRYAFGMGLRFTTPIGPIRLDAARPIRDEEDNWVLHFSIGHAF